MGIKMRVELKIMTYLQRHPEGLPTDQMYAWIRSCTKKGSYSLREFDEGLTRLRDEGAIACANGIWFTRSKVTGRRVVVPV